MYRFCQSTFNGKKNAWVSVSSWQISVNVHVVTTKIHMYMYVSNTDCFPHLCLIIDSWIRGISTWLSYSTTLQKLATYDA